MVEAMAAANALLRLRTRDKSLSVSIVCAVNPLSPKP